MDDVDRRTFLKRGSLVAAAAGVAAAIPLGTDALGSPAAGAAEPGPVDMPDPVVAHVIDARTGTIALYVGDREVTVQDRRLAAQLVNAVT